MHPYLLHSGHLLLPTFGVLAALGLMAALTLSLRTAALVGLNPDSLWNAALFTLLSAFALSRILLIATNLHNFLAYPILLLTVPSLTSTGILLTLLATLIYLRIRNLPLLDTLDAWSPPPRSSGPSSPSATSPKEATPASPPPSPGAFTSRPSASRPTTPAFTPSHSTPPSPLQSSRCSSSANSNTAVNPETQSPWPWPPQAPSSSSSPSSASPTRTPAARPTSSSTPSSGSPSV
ncbi:hypothetical protein RBB78_02455 [Tunturiibacter empetritectus]